MIKLRDLVTEWFYKGTPEVFFYPSEETFSRGKAKAKTLRVYGWFAKPGDRYGSTENVGGGITIGKKYKDEIVKYQKKYGIPNKKEIEAAKYINDAMWSVARKVPRKAYDKYNFYQFGNGSYSDMGYVYSGNKKFEIYLNIPREIRHPEEYSWVTDEDVQMFDNITNAIHKVAQKVKSMGFTVTINATPRGYKG